MTWHIAAAAVLLLLAARILFTAAAILIFSEVTVGVVGVSILHFGVCVHGVGPLEKKHYENYEIWYI